MKHDIAIAFTAYRRPSYAQIVLNYLQKCVGIEKCHISVHAEPENSETVKIINAINFTSNNVVVNEKVLGLRQNFLNAMNDAFIHANYAIWLADDVVPSSDFLEYNEWIRSTFSSNSTIFSACSNGLREVSPISKLFTASKSTSFVGRGLGIWKDRWEQLYKVILNNDYDHGKGWDYCGETAMAGRFRIYPLISRSRNLPHDNATATHHYPIEKWIASFLFRPWSDHYMPQDKVKEWILE